MMARCLNENCGKDPLKSMGAVVVSIDGDMCCSQECRSEYERQRDHFCRVVLNDDRLFADWLGIDPSNYQL